MLGKHVLCINKCMPAARFLQQGPTGCCVPALQSKDSGGSSSSNSIIPAGFSKQYLLSHSMFNMLGMQERACQLTSALTMDKEGCKPLAPGSLQGLLALCSMASVAAVREQACHALCRLVRPSAGCHACSHLQAAGASLILLQSLQGMRLTPAAQCPTCKLSEPNPVDPAALASRCTSGTLHVQSKLNINSAEVRAHDNIQKKV